MNFARTSVWFLFLPTYRTGDSRLPSCSWRLSTLFSLAPLRSVNKLTQLILKKLIKINLWVCLLVNMWKLLNIKHSTFLTLQVALANKIRWNELGMEATIGKIRQKQNKSEDINYRKRTHRTALKQMLCSTWTRNTVNFSWEGHVNKRYEFCIKFNKRYCLVVRESQLSGDDKSYNRNKWWSLYGYMWFVLCYGAVH